MDSFLIEKTDNCSFYAYTVGFLVSGIAQEIGRVFKKFS